MAWSTAELERRIDEVTVDAYGEHEQLESFACVIDELLDGPAPASVLGEPVELVEVRAGGSHVGLRARVRRNGRLADVALLDVTLVAATADSELVWTLAAYRHWLGDDLA